MTRTELAMQFVHGVVASLGGQARKPPASPAEAARVYMAGYDATLTAERAGMFGLNHTRAPLCPCPAVGCTALRDAAHAEICGGLPLTSDQVAAMNSFRVSGGCHIMETDP